HRVNVRLFQQLAIIEIMPRYPETFGGLFASLGMAFGNGDSRGAGTSGQADQMIQADPACSYHRTAKLFRHKALVLSVHCAPVGLLLPRFIKSLPRRVNV